MYKNKINTILLLIFLVNSLNADKLYEIQQKGYINIGVKQDFEPFGFIDSYGKLGGFDHDLAKYISNDLGVEAKLSIVTSKNRIDKLLDDEIDIIMASMTHSKKRDKLIDYSISYYFDGLAILTSKYVKVNHHFGFNGKKVGVIQGSSAGTTFRQKVYKARIVEFDNYNTALEALYLGKIDAVTTDATWCHIQANKSEGKLRVLPRLLSSEPYGFGIQQNQSNFVDAINFSLQNSVKDGTYRKLYQKWFKQEPTKLPEVWGN